jgi:hypothetical protein
MEWDHPCHQRALLHCMKCFKEQPPNCIRRNCVFALHGNTGNALPMHSNCGDVSVQSAVYEQQQVNDSKGHCTAMQCSYWQLQRPCHSNMAVICSVRTVTPPELQPPECAWHKHERGCSSHAHECICKQATHACSHATIVAETRMCLSIRSTSPTRTKAYRRPPTTRTTSTDCQNVLGALGYGPHQC